MRLVVMLVVFGWMPRADAQPSWNDVPAVLASATASVATDLRKCVKRVPKPIGLFATRAKDGTTTVAMPLPGLGGRGPTPEDRCLSTTAAKIALPALPAEVERLGFVHTIDDAPATPAFGAWSDLVGTLAKVIDAPRRTALAACDAKSRTVRVVLDRRKNATRVWLPAWQFHSPRGDGTTPAAERKVKMCLSKAIADWKPPVLPAAMGELQLAIPATH